MIAVTNAALINAGAKTTAMTIVRAMTKAVATKGQHGNSRRDKNGK